MQYFRLDLLQRKRKIYIAALNDTVPLPEQTGHSEVHHSTSYYKHSLYPYSSLVGQEPFWLWEQVWYTDSHLIQHISNSHLHNTIRTFYELTFKPCKWDKSVKREMHEDCMKKIMEIVIKAQQMDVI